MAARIRSKRNGILPVDESSRDDLVVGDVVSLLSIDGATTYAWSIVFAPAGSTATFSGSSTAITPGSFTVDLVGPYLIRLVVDSSLPTEDTQHVRLRALTVTLGLRLVSAGERRDGSGIIPVDVSTEGWANDQNFNLQTLENATSLTPPTTWAGTTLNAAPTEIFLNDIPGARFVLSDNTTRKFTLEIVAVNTLTGDAAGFKRSGVIKRRAGVGTTTLVGTTVDENTAADAGLAAANITATGDPVNGSLKIEVTGVAASNVQWVVVMNSVLTTG